MKEYLPILSGLFAIIGVILGASINYMSSRSLHFERASLEYRFETYRDFLTGQIMAKKGEASKARQDKEEDKEQAEEMIVKGNQLIRDSTLRIAVFSPKKVVVSVADWIRDGRKDRPCLEGDRFIKDLAMYHTMRSEAFKGDVRQMVSNRDMAMLIHGCNLDIEHSAVMPQKVQIMKKKDSAISKRATVNSADENKVSHTQNSGRGKR